MKSVNNYLDEIQSLNKNEQPPRRKNQQRPYDDCPESVQLRDIIIHDVILQKYSIIILIFLNQFHYNI